MAKYKIGDWLVGPKGSWYQVDDVNDVSYCLITMDGKREINTIKSVDGLSFPLTVRDIMNKLPKWKSTPTNEPELIGNRIVRNGYYLPIDNLFDVLPKE